MQQPTYDEQITMKNEMKLRELCAGLPAFCKEFFRGIEPTTSSRTRIAYAYDLKIFFHFLQEKYPDIEESDLKNWPVTVLDKVTLTQLEEYLDYLLLLLHLIASQFRQFLIGQWRVHVSSEDLTSLLYYF